MNFIDAYNSHEAQRGDVAYGHDNYLYIKISKNSSSSHASGSLDWIKIPTYHAYEEDSRSLQNGLLNRMVDLEVALLQSESKIKELEERFNKAFPEQKIEFTPIDAVGERKIELT